MADPEVMPIVIHDYFPCMEMTCRLAKLFKPEFEFIPIGQIRIGEEQLEAAAFCKETFHACRGAGAATAMQQQRLFH